jgi:UDP-3-O-[3-hydroxymyristoyl] glucosamine N-acyltransferase
MADPRFFDNTGPLDLTRIGQLTGAKLLSGPPATEIWDVASLDRAAPRHLSFCDSPKFSGALKQTQASAVFVTPVLAAHVPSHVQALECARPSMAFAQVATALYPNAGAIWPSGKPPVMSVAPTARIGNDTVIAPGAFIGEDVEIGDRVVIAPGVVIGRGVRIGHGTQVGSGVTISHALIGDSCIILPGARIGQEGFGFVNSPQGHFKIPQLGRMIMQDHVEIGANATIDRGALGDTVIGEGTKIDNLVHIAHNTVIGRHCIIVAQVGISGSCEIGDFAVLGGQVGVADHTKIGKGAYIAGRTGVTSSLDGGRVYGGFPARPIEQWRREVAVVSRMAKKTRTKND